MHVRDESKSVHFAHVQKNVFTLHTLYVTYTISGTTTCNFDSRSLCTWTNDHQNDQFDWQLRNGRTPSGQTGPSNDHTKGNIAGRYSPYFSL